MPYTMNAVYRIFVLFFYICGSNSIKYDSREEQLHCIKACRDTRNRFCQQPPDVCGDCLQSFEERHGACEPTKVIDLQKSPGAAALPDEKLPENQSGGKTDVTKDEIVFAVKKDQGDMNYAVNAGNQSTDDVLQQPSDTSITNDILFIAVIASISVAALIGIIIAVVCWCTLKKSAKETSDFEYPGYGSMDYKSANVKGAGDRRLAQSAQMYHYQHHKQQMLEMERNQGAVSRSGSDVSSDDDNDANEYTVYECPGLATAGEMEVPNPLFAEPPESCPDASQESAENQAPHTVNGYKES